MSRMRNTLHATLKNGGYRYEYEDGTGLRCTVNRSTRRDPEVQFWTHDMLADQKFGSYNAIAAVLAALTPEQRAAEAAWYPKLGPVDRDPCGNRCRLCPIDPEHKLGDKYETWRFHVWTSWQGSHDASLCKAHTDEFYGKPVELLAALKAEIAERKARSKEFMAKLRASHPGEADYG